MRKHSRTLAVALAALAVTGFLAAPAGAAAADGGDDPAFVVDLEADGDATVTLLLTYDLDDGDERDAFDELREDEEARTDFRDRFESRLSDVADGTASETDRDMSVSDSRIDLYTTDDDVGVVELSARWHGLGGADDDSVTVTEPFASGFTPNQQFVLVGPDGYEVTSATPEADDSEDGTLVWSAGTDLDGFEVTFTDAAAADDGDDTADESANDADETGDDAPGFGVAVAVVALVVAAIAAIRRRQ